jgi:hypothetical protein
MAKKTLNDHLVTYYERKHISPQTLANLRAIIVEAGEGQKKRWNRFHLPRPPLKRFFFSPAVSAFVCVLIFLGYITLMVTDGPGSGDAQFNLSKALAREIAMNHRKQLDVEFIAKTIFDLGQQMDKLDFSAVNPDKLPVAFSIVGARYCSIQGGIAAQIQLTDTAGHYYTIYQTRLKPLLIDIQDEVFDFDGLQLKLWQEDGVFLGLAGPAE